MKIQCACGAKYAFDITPEMVDAPIEFVCPSCGLDSSELVNRLIREEIGVATAEISSEKPVPQIEQSSPTPTATPSLRIQSHTTTAPQEQASQLGSQPCPKHPGQQAMERCVICNKPICPKCMELFGYVCSAYCKAKAENQRIKVPTYANQKTVIEAQFWKKVGRIGALTSLILAALFGIWAWYNFFGSHPAVAFSVRFPEKSYSGQCFLCSKNQALVLHGGRLARYDIKAKKEMWSVVLIEQKKTADDEFAERVALASLQLKAQDEHVWVALPNKLARFDWQTGKLVKEIPLNNLFHQIISKNNELLLIEEMEGGKRITHIDLVSDESRVEDISGSRTTLPAANAGISPETKPLNSSAIAAQVQNLSLPAKLTLPATLAAAANQQRALAEMRDSPPSFATQSGAGLRNLDYFSLVPDGDGFIQFSVQLIESRIVARQAIKAPPKKSTLEGNVTAAATADVANEILNEMQRNRGGDTVEEDESRYYVKLRRPDENRAQWAGEVIGSPKLFPQKTVTALTAGKSVLVFDKSAKKLWESKLNYEVVGEYNGFKQEDSTSPVSPCVEHGDTLYVFDQGVLTAFDLATGNARWRLPSVGVSRLFFDDKGMLYANTTTASPDNIKYSRQIDVRDRIDPVIMKIDAKTGKILWQLLRKGHLNCISGKFFYSIEVKQGDEYAELSDLEKIGQAIHGAPHVFIWRINPKNGNVMWEHYQERPPLDLRFDKNRIELLFKKELQVLKYFSL